MNASVVSITNKYEVFGFMERPDSPVALGGQKAIDLYAAYQQYYQAAAERLGLTESP